jgi:hypothetical protein
MSKMRLSKAVTAAVLFAALAACNRQPDVNSPNVRGIGYVRVDDVVKKHPLYGQLAQIDDAMNALQLQSLGPAVPKTGAQIAEETRRLNAELRAAQDRANATLRQKQQDFQQREQAAIRAAMVAAGQGNAGANAGAAMQNVSAQQAQAVTQQANQDLLNFQQQTIAQDNAAVQAIQRSLNERADRAYRDRVVQLQERESEYGLQLSQQDASKRLELRTKLSNLALDDTVRNQYRSQLDALNKEEAGAVGAMRARDQQQLAAYRKQLQAQTAAQVASEAAKIHAQTQSKLQSHRNDVSAQVRSQIGVPQAQASPLSPALRAKLAQIDKQFKTQFQEEAQKTIADYQATKADLDAQYAALQGADGAAGLAGNKQLANLQRQHDDLYNKIVEQIKREAGTIAGQRGLKVVFMNVDAAPGGYDLTDEVEKDIESLHE